MKFYASVIKYPIKVATSLLLPLAVSLNIFIPDHAHADTMRVITKENTIRETCRFFAPVKGVVKYGDTLEIVSTEGDWFRVKFKGIAGCIHKGAVETRAVSSFQGIGSPKQGATEQEVALAGKGFNPQVENAFKAKHPEMNFALVNAIEGYRVEEKRVFEFIRLGGLTQP